MGLAILLLELRIDSIKFLYFNANFISRRRGIGIADVCYNRQKPPDRSQALLHRISLPAVTCAIVGDGVKICFQ